MIQQPDAMYWVAEMELGLKFQLVTRPDLRIVDPVTRAGQRMFSKSLKQWLGLSGNYKKLQPQYVTPYTWDNVALHASEHQTPAIQQCLYQGIRCCEKNGTQFVSSDQVNLTKIHHMFAANNATCNTAAKTQTGSNSGYDILTRDPSQIVDLVPTLLHSTG